MGLIYGIRPRVSLQICIRELLISYLGAQLFRLHAQKRSQCESAFATNATLQLSESDFWMLGNYFNDSAKVTEGTEEHSTKSHVPKDPYL